jgi:hypothetical protein
MHAKQLQVLNIVIKRRKFSKYRKNKDFGALRRARDINFAAQGNDMRIFEAQYNVQWVTITIVTNSSTKISPGEAKTTKYELLARTK